ncbi:MAG: HAMP domain-containing sensor histidine kinase [Eubacteriaceae bacterium]|nr:HAMP domain-containing sensor histidine kinase [Eubacteriaceae bacterium]
MDTKLKKSNGTSRKTFCFISGAICVAASSMTLILAIALLSGYDLIWQMPGKYLAGNPGISEYMGKLWMLGGSSLLIALISLIAAVVFVGFRDDEGKINLNRFDRWFVEFQLCLGTLAVTALVGLTVFFAEELIPYSDPYKVLVDSLRSSVKAEDADMLWFHVSNLDETFIPVPILVIGSFIGTALSFAVGLVCILSIFKRIKAGRFWNHTVIGRIISILVGAFRASDNTTLKVMGACILGALLSASWLGFIPVLILICAVVPRWLKKYKRVKQGINELKNGNLEYKIPIEGDGELDRLAMDVNEISSATGIAVENENKSVRMKTELISNVSHDLKTPLTSMISYVDLMKREGLDSPNAPEYLDIVQEKTLRLKKLTEDLFDAAKASSGAISVNMQQIEMVSMVNQALAETEERFTSRGLSVIFTNKADSAYVKADGQLLWRVMENLFVNAGKYALANSRVYIDIVEKGDCLTLEVKNMSEAQLNISADELMERFKRGDESRNTEGSGLGLAIAKDLTELMDGKLELKIDGDLFKACVTLSKGEAPAEVSTETETE